MMQANEPRSDEYAAIVREVGALVRYTVNGIRQFTEYARRMDSSYSDVDNGYLAGALDDLTRSLATVGEDAQYVRLHAIRCQTEAELREKQDKQNDEDQQEGKEDEE